MTAGNDILFPGCNALLTLDNALAERIMADISEREPPDFAYIALNAWGEPGTVGTVAVIEDFKYAPSQDSSMLLCAGVSRFRVVHINDDLTQARVRTFQDEPSAEENMDVVIELEQSIFSAMRNIVSLTLKISDDADQTRQLALSETLARVEAFCGHENADNIAHHWILDLSPDLRRELISFIVIDLLSVSFMDRRQILESTDTEDRLDAAVKGLEPFVRELAAKGAILGALGQNDASDRPPPSTPPSS